MASAAAIRQLRAAAAAADNPLLATFAAHALVSEVDGGCRDPEYLAMVDASLELLRSLGLSSGHLTRYEADRWVEVHGDLRTTFDGIVERDVSPPVPPPAVDELAIGEARLIAKTGPEDDDNHFFLERGRDGLVGVFSIRTRSDEDPTRDRYEEDHLGRSESVHGMLVAVAEMFRVEPYWAHRDLGPYFPERRLPR